MAKYTVIHRCGHTQDHQIYGDVRHRQAELAKLRGMLCKACWAAEMGLRASIVDNLYSDGVCVVVRGNTYPIKDVLKAQGFRWGEYYDDNDLLGVHPLRGWIYKVDSADTIDTIAATLVELGVELDNAPNANAAAIIAAQITDRVTHSTG